MGIHYLIPFILLFPSILKAQKEIQVFYEPETHSIRISPDKNVLQSGHSYRIVYHNVNPVYIQNKTKIRSFRYISSTPEILESILPGIPGSNVFHHFDVKPTGQREFFLKALRFYNELETLRSESDDLYLHSRLDADPSLAREKMDRMEAIFGTSDIQEMVSRILYYQDYIMAAESVYKTNIRKVTLKTPDADVVLEEFSRLTRISNKIRDINYVRLLHFIAQSTEAGERILTDVFRAEKDLTTVHLILYDQYINDTLYADKWMFHTEQNWSFDFTTGFFFTNLYDKEYFLQETNDLQNRITEENKLKGDVSIGALAHYTYKIKPNLRIGPSIGGSISPIDGKFRYLSGISTFIGNKKILGLSAGITIGQSQVLSKGILSDEQGPYLPASENKIPTYSRIKTGFFIGLTYNITRTQIP